MIRITLHPYIVAVNDFLTAMRNTGGIVSSAAKRSLCKRPSMPFLTGYSQGTRYGIRMDQDSLLAAGVPGMQLTWMDAKVGERVVTPRIGKPVEVQALWLNALWIGGQLNDQWQEPLTRGLQSFRQRFWHQQAYLFDVIDVDHERWKASMRLFVPIRSSPLAGCRCRSSTVNEPTKYVDAVERCLWTPLGLRSLAPRDPNYVGHYLGGVHERDGAYHQGTVWPWLIGAFVEAWVRVRGTPPKPSAKRERVSSPR